MNRHQLATLATAAAQYRQHIEHRQRLIAALNEGRLTVPTLRLFEQRRPAAKVKRLRRVAA